MLGHLIDLAKAGGAIARNHFAKVAATEVIEKSARDYVSHVDRAVEDAIVRRIRARHPDHAILGEEGVDAVAGDAARALWIIDPIDGTTNFIRGIPLYAVSIAFIDHGRPRFACVYDPSRDECFTAENGAGLWLNGERRYTSGRTDLGKAVLASALPFRFPQCLPDALATFGAIQLACDDHRRSGSAALDMAWTAVGRLDGYYELGIYPWDVAAGEILVRAGGGMASDLSGYEPEVTARRGSLAAATAELHRALLTRVGALAGWAKRPPFAGPPRT